MDTLHIIILAILQGLTEFLPISSSGHLILFPQLTGWKDQGLAFDIAVHVGSLLAVLMYFRHELKPLLISWFLSCKTKQLTFESKLAWAIGFGTIPVGLVGLTISIYGWEEQLRSPIIIATTTILFALLLWFADILGNKKRNEFSLNWKDILLIGIAQALALIPGTSRSGITITAALFLGLNRQAATRFSFLLAIPVIILAGASETITLLNQNTTVDWNMLWLAVFFSAVSAYLCIKIFINLLDHTGMLPFVLYRLGLGVLLIWMM
ncbi:undecaprenyl-diphosphate phosphatase [Candidatus Halobeggiatoa sp. HSG11]|nr:undecaprenyl-diphosphate phosphatase [Candidatus Halobeggiatoa sp. HSG11]